MDEYINRKKLMKELSESVEPFNTGSVFRAIRKQPAADVAPVAHGRWNDGDPYCPICRKDKFRGLYADVWEDWKPDYCPNCGAKMDGDSQCE